MVNDPLSALRQEPSKKGRGVERTLAHINILEGISHQQMLVAEEFPRISPV